MSQQAHPLASVLLRRSLRRVAFACLLGTVAALACGCFLQPNLPPIARILADGLEGTPPFAVSFDGTTSTDEDGIVCGYQWSFGDGVTSSAMRPSYAYALPGDYIVTLKVTDDDGDSSATEVTVTVTAPNSPPVANFTAVPSAVIPGEVVTFDAAGSVDGDGWIAAYHWDFGDGTVGSGVIVEHDYATNGTVSVVLSVVDNDGAVGVVQSEMLVIDTNQAPKPQLEVSSTSLDPGDTLLCSAAGSVDPDGEIVSYEWSFGDGSQASGATASHVYHAEGIYRIRLTAMDDQGAMQATECVITVGSPTAPTPDPVPTPTPVDGILCNFRWSYGGSLRALSLSVPEALLNSYSAMPRGVWADDGYSRFVLDPADDALMLELRDKLLLNNSYQATIENALAFVQGAIDYQLDPQGIEYPRYPIETLVDGIGDCEDTAILYASIVRTFGYSAGVLLILVDTNGDQVADHVAVLVRVADCFIAAHPERSLWVISGRTYAYAETALSGGYLALGIDPWGLEQEDIHAIWDVANPTISLQATRRLP